MTSVLDASVLVSVLSPLERHHASALALAYERPLLTLDSEIRDRMADSYPELEVVGLA